GRRVRASRCPEDASGRGGARASRMRRRRPDPIEASDAGLVGPAQELRALVAEAPRPAAADPIFRDRVLARQLPEVRAPDLQELSRPPARENLFLCRLFDPHTIPRLVSWSHMAPPSTERVPRPQLRPRQRLAVTPGELRSASRRPADRVLRQLDPRQT